MALWRGLRCSSSWRFTVSEGFPKLGRGSCGRGWRGDIGSGLCQLLGVGGDRGLDEVVGVTVLTGVHGIVSVSCVHASVVLGRLLGRVLCWCFCWVEGKALGGSFLIIREVFVFS